MAISVTLGSCNLPFFFPFRQPFPFCSSGSSQFVRPYRHSAASKLCLNNFPVFHFVNHITLFDRIQSVRNDDHRLPAVETVDCLHQHFLRLIIKSGSGLVKHQNLRVMIQRPCNTDPLSLSAGKPYPRSPIAVSSPCGRDFTKSFSCASSSTSHIRSSEIPESAMPKAILFLMGSSTR